MTGRAAPDVSPLNLVGHGVISVVDPTECTANRPSFYADPIAWLVVAAVDRAMTGRRSPVEPPDDVAVLVMTNVLTLPTGKVIAGGVARGRVSPLRFAGANPGILAGLPCIRWGWRGPSLVLSTAAECAVDVALVTIREWLDSGQASHVVCVAHHEYTDRQVARCVIVRAADGRPGHDAEIRSLLHEPGAVAVKEPVHVPR